MLHLIRSFKALILELAENKAVLIFGSGIRLDPIFNPPTVGEPTRRPQPGGAACLGGAGDGEAGQLCRASY